MYLAYYSKTNCWDGGRVGGCLIATDRHTLTHDMAKEHPFFKTAKYFKIMQTTCHSCSFTSMHMDYLQIEKYRLSILFLWSPPNPSPNPPKCLCHPCNQPFNILPHIANKARTIKAVSKNSFTQMGKQKSTLKKKKKKDSQAKKQTNKKKTNVGKDRLGEMLQYEPKGCICLRWVFCFLKIPLTC